jgi:D-alanyl-D-alanine carboxypeptidase
LLSAQNSDLLTTAKVDTPRGDKYAFGFMDNGRGTPLRHFGHGGGAPGMNGDLEIFWQSGYVIAVLSNLAQPSQLRTIFGVFAISFVVKSRVSIAKL